jgi:hypothetical protein
VGKLFQIVFQLLLFIIGSIFLWIGYIYLSSLTALDIPTPWGKPPVYVPFIFFFLGIAYIGYSLYLFVNRKNKISGWLIILGSIMILLPISLYVLILISVIGVTKGGL